MSQRVAGRIPAQILRVISRRFALAVTAANTIDELVDRSPKTVDYFSLK
jgi:hypothetical protein